MALTNEVPCGTDLEGLVSEVLSVGRGAHLRHHGAEHWKRTAALGATLTEHVAGADPIVVFLFTLFHDSERTTDLRDPGHGRRGAELALKLHETGKFGLSFARIALLEYACIRHDDGLISTDPTVGVCFDSDRLDLYRMNIKPNPSRLSTSIAKSQFMKERAMELQKSNLSWRELVSRYVLSWN